jgi:hypothetical protein
MAYTFFIEPYNNSVKNYYLSDLSFSFLYAEEEINSSIRFFKRVDGQRNMNC